MKAYAAQLSRPSAERDRLISEHVEVARRISMRIARRCPDWIAREDLYGAALLGLTDTDALTYSLSERADSIGGPGLAAFAIAVGLLSNTLVRGGLALGLGRGKYRTAAVTGLGLLAAATGAGIALLPR